MILDLLTVVLGLAGVAFLALAAVGVLRFPDPLQRMHASTKAGSVGAVLVLLSAMLAHATLASVVVGGLAVLFLLLTLPVAAHLLGRAVYVSGAPLVGLREDPLEGVLERQAAPLEERILPAPLDGIGDTPDEGGHGDEPPRAPISTGSR